MTQAIGAESGDLIASLAQPPVVGLRLNRLRLRDAAAVRSVSGRLPWGVSGVPWCQDGFVLDGGHADGQAGSQADAHTGGDSGVRPGSHPWHDAGVYYLQDPAAMAVAQAMAPRPGESVLDLAAAPGGKSTHLAALMGGQGLLVSNDHHGARARTLVGNIERSGVANAVVCQSEPVRLAESFGAAFDRVLLDAPCSGEGMFRKSEAARRGWSPATVAACAVRQRGLIDVAARLVRPGGLLAYSTCTFSREENEDIVEAFLERHPDFEPEPIDLPGVSPALAAADAEASPSRRALGRGAVRIWPHRSAGEGHFVALLRRSLSGPEAPLVAWATRSKARRPLPVRRPSAEQTRLARDFFAAVAASGTSGCLDENRLFAHGDRLLLAPRDIELGGVHVIRLGLALGEVRRTGRRSRFVPAHAAAMATGTALDLTTYDLDLGDPRISLFLAGEAFPAEGVDSDVVVSAGGYPLGWGLMRGGSVRSMLPSGLRRR